MVRTPPGSIVQVAVSRSVVWRLAERLRCRVNLPPDRSGWLPALIQAWQPTRASRTGSQPGWN